MSEPITLTERERAVFAYMARVLGCGGAGDGVLVSNAVLHFLDTDFRARHAESASPPRAPVGITGPVLPVESGPGQPIPPHVPDVADALDGWAAQYSEPENINARHLREAAAEIRRLRGEIAAMNSLVDRTFDDLGVLREQVKTERRAGIEAAANWHANQRKQWGTAADSPAGTRADIVQVARANIHRVCEDAIRALADKPAPSDNGG